MAPGFGEVSRWPATLSHLAKVGRRLVPGAPALVDGGPGVAGKLIASMGYWTLPWETQGLCVALAGL